MTGAVTLLPPPPDRGGFKRRPKMDLNALPRVFLARWEVQEAENERLVNLVEQLSRAGGPDVAVVAQLQQELRDAKALGKEQEARARVAEAQVLSLGRTAAAAEERAALAGAQLDRAAPAAAAEAEKESLRRAEKRATDAEN